MESEGEQVADNFEYLVTDRETIVSLLLPHVRDINQTTPGTLGCRAVTTIIMNSHYYHYLIIIQGASRP